MSILQEIVQHKKSELSIAKQEKKPSDLRSMEFYARESISLTKRLLSLPPGIIAEFKRKSPSKQNINIAADPVKIAQAYQAAGAAGMSVLTDQDYFGGSFDDLLAIRRSGSDLPILRKDFMIDPYQVIEAKAIGADVILLIAEVLEASQLRELAQAANEEGMQVLMEIHSKEQLEKVCPEVDIIGVNNRNLKTFVTDFNNSLDLLPFLPKDKTVISESGIGKTETVATLRKAGFNGFLIGEHFMKADNPEEELRSFIGKGEVQRALEIKVCGLTERMPAQDLADLSCELVGFNFYPASKRFVDDPKPFKSVKGKRVGVFVNAALEELRKRTEAFDLDFAQLHGDENAAFCEAVEQFVPVIKVFRVDEDFDFDQCQDFSEACTFFLFDTYTKEYGGSGKKFAWEKLQQYKMDKPFFLSGGIAPDDLEKLKALSHPQLLGLDINSGFESAPGVKRVTVVNKFVNQVKQRK